MTEKELENYPDIVSYVNDIEQRWKAFEEKGISPAFLYVEIPKLIDVIRLILDNR